jgi:hypothetical protein
VPLTKPLISIAAAILVAAGVFTRVGGSDPAQPSPLAGVEEAVVGTIEKGLEFLSVAVDTVLPYRLPEVLPNGDIIIRYAPLPETPPAEPVPEDESPVLETSET